MQSEDKLKLLSDAIKISDHPTIYQHSKHLLREQPEDLLFQQCFILSAIKTGKHEEVASSHFKAAPSAPELQHLYAYFLYDRGEFAKTIQYISSLKSSSSLRLLLAQAHFRASNYAESAELMLGLLKDSDLLEEEKEEYIINLMATGLNRALSA
jgi:predicted Zn-dependent protease